MRYDLNCRYDSRQSFYGKAQVEEKRTGDYYKAELYSYGTLVASVEYFYDNGDVVRTIYKYMGKYSQTTTRHQKEFFRQNGLSDKEIKALFNSGTLTIEEV